jgi:hypothetical protein
MTVAAQAYGSGDWRCGSIRGAQSLVQASSLAFPPSALKNVGAWATNPLWYEMGKKVRLVSVPCANAVRR